MWKKDKRPAEKSAAPPADEVAALALFTEIRDLMKDNRDDIRWLREKLEAANVLGK